MRETHTHTHLPFVASKEEELRSVFPKSFAKLVGVVPFCPFPPFFRESGGDGRYGDKKIPGDPNCAKSTLNRLPYFDDTGDLTGVLASGARVLVGGTGLGCRCLKT
jgi:hypothetical protein